MLECKPKIIHISCHGYYKESLNNEFVLAFESSKKIGVRDEVNPGRLKRILQPYSNYEGIVIVSACYSQAIGHVFLEAGMKFVITIHDQCKIHDEAAITFSVTFYRNIFKGKTISQAFQEACDRVSAMQTNISTCCCVHNHVRSCLAKNKDHSEHTPTAACKCDKKHNFSIHKIDCEYAENYNRKYQPSRVPSEDETRSGYWIICCCPLPLVPHTEAMKFTLLKKHPDLPDRPLFTGGEIFELREIQELEIAYKPPAIDTKITGRGTEMKEILEFLSGKNRILIVHGRAGIGKTLLMKHVSKYAFERKLFKDGIIYLDMKGKKYTRSISKMLAKKLNSPREKSNEQLARIIDSMYIMVIIDNIESKAFDQLIELGTKISYFHERTQYPKFCIVLDNSIVIDQADSYEIGPLKKNYISSLVKSSLETRLYQRIRPKLKELIDRIDCSPSSV